MGYAIIEVDLTEKQLEEINAAIGDGIDSGQQFALLAQPWIRGSRTGTMSIMIVTPEQYKLIDKGVRAGRALDAFVKD